MEELTRKSKAGDNKNWIIIKGVREGMDKEGREMGRERKKIIDT